LFTLFVITLEAHLDYGDSITTHTMSLYRGVGIFTQLWLPYILFSLEVVFNVLLLVGAHMKQTRLIRIYYYYGIMTVVAACLTFVVVRFQNQYRDFYFDIFEFCLCFSAF
ncbi:Uncharacterized protein OBRU01_11573, partial [Operophtera brumata]